MEKNWVPKKSNELTEVIQECHGRTGSGNQPFQLPVCCLFHFTTLPLDSYLQKILFPHCIANVCTKNVNSKTKRTVDYQINRSRWVALGDRKKESKWITGNYISRLNGGSTARTASKGSGRSGHCHHSFSSLSVKFCRLYFINSGCHCFGGLVMRPNYLCGMNGPFYELFSSKGTSALHSRAPPYCPCCQGELSRIQISSCQCPA